VLQSIDQILWLALADITNKRLYHGKQIANQIYAGLEVAQYSGCF
jgi:hypothetical protein